MEYIVNGHRLSYEAEGKTARGENEVLLSKAVDLTSKTSWAKNGFSIQPLFDKHTFQEFISGTKELLINAWRNSGLDVDRNFPLDQYHQKAISTEQHLKAVDKTKLLDVDALPLGVKKMEERISEICKTDLVAKNPFDNQSIFHFRVIRPKRADNNPLHRDVWLEDYDDCINLYIPIAGSNPNSSLIIFPGSHLWPESRLEKTTEGALINGVKFNVPAITSISGEYEVTRPDPKENDVLVFSPYLVHGGAVNLNPDTTRISIEMRLWKKSPHL